MRASAQETGPVYDVGLVLQQGREQELIFHRIILKVRVLNDHEISGCSLDATAQRGSLAEVARLQDDLYLGMLAFKLGENLARAVGRAIVHAQEFDVERDGKNFGDDLP